ncbi:hypothetical protein H9638_05395 [Arthrobacter sp. Sa2BUA2]|uniref:Uncharacterized protein n=1 Tax=Arthrobacter pullicola TaxID=2762224 RepID=A0ABR8YG95_9MICC|nr:hypothetical protein [Arthrobacter pullicola]MBD8043244.1 hypothetical protein [Arthrobacter pullicola]
MLWRSKPVARRLLAILALAPVLGYLLGLVFVQLGTEESPWKACISVSAAALVSATVVYRREAAFAALKRDPEAYIQRKGLSRNNRLALWLNTGLSIFVSCSLVLLVLIWGRQDDGLLLLVFGAVLACMWGFTVYVLVSTRKRITRTGLHCSAHGQGRLAAAQLAPGLPYAETRRLIEGELHGNPAFSLIEESGRSLWLRTRKARRHELVIHVELQPAGRLTEIQARSFPIGRMTNNTAAHGAEALVTLLDGLADAAAGHADTFPEPDGSTQARRGVTP